jgi:putative membrane protein
MYPDLNGFLAHLNTFAGTATEVQRPEIPKNGFWKELGQDMGFSFAKDNPLKEIKNSNMPLGNLPLEILTYIGAFIDHAIETGQLTVPMQQSVACEYFSLSLHFNSDRRANSQ